MKSSHLIALLITVVTVAWVASGMIGDDTDLHASDEALRPPAAIHRETPVPQVRVHPQKAEVRVSTLLVLGQTESSRVVDVKAETAGRVVETGAEKGARVNPDSLLVRLSMEDRMERLSRAEATVARWEDRYKADQRLANRDFTSRQRVLESKAALEDARANLAAMMLDIDHTAVTAPFAGVLVTRMAEEGDYVGIGDPVARVVDLDPLKVVAKVAESEIGRIRLGQRGQAVLVTNQRLEGKVSYIAPVADGVTRTFAVELEFPNPDQSVPEGMTARVELPLEESTAHQVSPALLALNEEGRIGVKLVNDDNIVEFHPVSVAGDGENGLWVEGLPDPANLIVVGQEFVRAGQRVKPVEVETIEANTQALAAADSEALAAGRTPDATIDSIELDRAEDAGPSGSDQP